MEYLDSVRLNVEQGLRHFLTNCGFRLPGEAQKIVNTFARCYFEDNAGDSKCFPFSEEDTILVLVSCSIRTFTRVHDHGRTGDE
jgi:Sec7-like guanine-nucleotide exchange factor